MAIRLLILISLVYWTSRSFSAYLTKCDVVGINHNSKFDVKDAVPRPLKTDKINQEIASLRVEKVSSSKGLLHLIVKPSESNKEKFKDYEVKTFSGNLNSNKSQIAFSSRLGASSEKNPVILVKDKKGTLSFGEQSYSVTCQ
jgi:hypothetical protein